MGFKEIKQYTYSAQNYPIDELDNEEIGCYSEDYADPENKQILQQVLYPSMDSGNCQLSKGDVLEFYISI